MTKNTHLITSALLLLFIALAYGVSPHAIMLRSQLNPLPEYFDRYILMTDDVELLDAIQPLIQP